MFCYRYNSSLTNSTQFGNDSNYSKFNEENIATNCSMVTVGALDGLTKKHFGHYALSKIFPLRSPSNKHRVLFRNLIFQDHRFQADKGFKVNREAATKIISIDLVYDMNYRMPAHETSSNQINLVKCEVYSLTLPPVLNTGLGDLGCD